MEVKKHFYSLEFASKDSIDYLFFFVRAVEIILRKH
jgi:hypothetical protein